MWIISNDDERSINIDHYPELIIRKYDRYWELVAHANDKADCILGRTPLECKGVLYLMRGMIMERIHLELPYCYASELLKLAQSSYIKHGDKH